tara:strand:+ start:105 stop:218 length:114 start_codon:yes stop_codon:yes gene_type:complete
MLYLRAWKKILVLIELAKTPLKKNSFPTPLGDATFAS